MSWLHQKQLYLFVISNPFLIRTISKFNGVLASKNTVGEMFECTDLPEEHDSVYSFELTDELEVLSSESNW